MSIGQLAERAGVTTRTVRYYEELGLLDNKARTERGYRIYDEQTLKRLRLIRRGKSFGLSLMEIKELIEIRRKYNTNASVIHRSIEILKPHLEKARRRQEELGNYIAGLEKELARLEDFLKRQGEKS